MGTREPRGFLLKCLLFRSLCLARMLRILIPVRAPAVPTQKKPEQIRVLLSQHLHTQNPFLTAQLSFLLIHKAEFRSFPPFKFRLISANRDERRAEASPLHL